MSYEKLFNGHFSRVITLKLSRIRRSVYQGIRLRAPLLRGLGVEIDHQVVLLTCTKLVFFVMENLNYGFNKGLLNVTFRSISCFEVIRK